MLGLKAGDRMVFEVSEGTVTLRPAASPLWAGFGAITPMRRPEDFGALRNAFEEGVAADVIADRE